MFSRWGIEGMKSFEQAAVREKELPQYSQSLSGDQSPSAAASVNVI